MAIKQGHLLGSVFTSNTNQEKKGYSRSHPYRGPMQTLYQEAGKAISYSFSETPSRCESFNETRKPWNTRELRPVLCHSWQGLARLGLLQGLTLTTWIPHAKSMVTFFPLCKAEAGLQQIKDRKVDIL